MLPDAIVGKLIERPASTASARCTPRSTTVRRGGTISISGVYGGMVDPMPMMRLFDKQIQLRMGQANVRRWVDILPLLADDDPLGAEASPPTRCRSPRPPGRTRSSRRRTTVKVLLQP